MPSNQKQVYTQTFTNGVDTVTAPEYLTPQTARYMLNCVVLSTASGNVGVVTNVKGNVLVENTLPDGRCRMLGWREDEEADKFYYWVWNENLYHTIYRYDGLLNSIDPVMQNLTDTGGIDIFGWTEEDLVLMSDVVQNNLLYWVKKGNDAAKINIEKAMDKSSSGYGIITEEIVNAYKLAPVSAPVSVYYSDTQINVNRLYGTLAKFACRFIYDNGEISNWSDYSNVAIPAKESFTGVNFVPTDNNALNITVPTGSSIVERIEIAMQYTLDGGYSNWVLIATLDKERLSLGDNSQYTYTFYNDGQYSPVDPEKIIRPYSYLPKEPLVQAFTKNSMVYGNFYEGFEVVDIEMSFEETVYEPLFLDDSVENRLSEAEILVQELEVDYVQGGVVYLNGTTGIIATRASKYRLTIGSDVVAGNKFQARFTNGYDDVSIEYLATNTDTPTNVANNLKNQLIGSGRLLKATDELGTVDIYVNTNTGGDISFDFIIYASPKKQYLGATYSVNQVNISTLKDTGQSLSNMKMGSATKYGIMYEDFQGRRSLVYTDTDLIVKIDSQNELGGIKKVKLILNVNHIPPVWARWFQIVRTDDLTYQSFLQMVIQEVTEVISTDIDSGEYLDLTIGSLFTYQKIHPNTILKYNFTKGDRIRFISKEDGSYYDFLESEILAYNETVTTEVKENVTTTGTADVAVDATSADNIGKVILIDGNEREIIAVADGTHYTLNAPIGGADDLTYLSYTIIDRRGSIRIRKPAETIEDISLVEIFTPSFATDLNDKQFYHFNKKFEIINAGQPTRMHFGDIQPQTNAQPAKISITEGTVYVRSREMPITNNIPAQVVIRTVEHEQYSDFYYSLINDNGKTNVEDNGAGVVHFGERLRVSNNYIEDTKINGLNDFDNLDRKDYNDKYGDFMLLVFVEQQLLSFKKLKVGIIPVFQTIIVDESGQDLLGTSSKLLNEIRYYSHTGGIGNNPESYCSNASQHYYVSVGEGIYVRLGGDGATPISEVYFFDNEMSAILADAYRNGAKIYSQWDVDLSTVVIAVSDFNLYTFNSVFNQANWKIATDAPPSDSPVELLTSTANGVVTLDGTTATVVEDYLGDDSFTYRVFVGGVWVNKKVCITYKEIPNRMTAWRARYSDAECQLEEGENTGNLIFITLEQYYTDNGAATGLTKPNTIGDPDYVAMIQDLVTCPFDGEVFYSAEYTAYASRNNCVLPAVPGAPVPFTAEEGAFTSVIDQDTADQKAIDYVEAGKQANANSFGTCTTTTTFGNVYMSRTLGRNDCGGGLVGSLVTYVVPANTFTASTQVAADNLAIANMDANAQTWANNPANGSTCVAASYFDLEVVIYNDYNNARYSNSDSRGVSFELTQGIGYATTVFAEFVSTTITRDATIYTFSVPFAGASIAINGFRGYLQHASTSVAMTVSEKVRKNGSVTSIISRSISAGLSTGTQYIIMVPTTALTMVAGDVLTVQHGNPEPEEDLLYLTVENDTTGTDCTVTEVSLGSEAVPLSLDAGDSVINEEVGYTTTPISVSCELTFSSGSTSAFYYVSFFKNASLIATKSYDKTAAGSGSTTLTQTGVTVAIDDEIRVQVTFEAYSLLGTFQGDYVSSGDACALMTSGEYLLYTSGTDGLLEVGDKAMQIDFSSGYGRLIPIDIPPAPDNFIAYRLEDVPLAQVYWAEVDPSTGIVLDQGTCEDAPTCDLEIEFVGKTDESVAGADDGTITITGSTSNPDGFLLSKDGGDFYIYTGTSPFTFEDLAPGTYTICAINGDETCSTCLAPITINAAVLIDNFISIDFNRVNGTTFTLDLFSTYNVATSVLVRVQLTGVDLAVEPYGPGIFEGTLTIGNDESLHISYGNVVDVGASAVILYVAPTSDSTFNYIPV